MVWNSKFSDMACFSGKNIFNIKVNEFTAHQQRIIVRNLIISSNK